MTTSHNSTLPNLNPAILKIHSSNLPTIQSDSSFPLMLGSRLATDLFMINRSTSIKARSISLGVTRQMDIPARAKAVQSADVS